MILQPHNRYLCDMRITIAAKAQNREERNFFIAFVEKFPRIHVGEWEREWAELKNTVELLSTTIVFNLRKKCLLIVYICCFFCYVSFPLFIRYRWCAVWGNFLCGKREIITVFLSLLWIYLLLNLFQHS